MGMREVHFPSAPVRYIDCLAAKHLCPLLPELCRACMRAVSVSKFNTFNPHCLL
jgi:hypothetical protein